MMSPGRKAGGATASISENSVCSWSIQL